jgi:Peptidase inhibitor family I36
VQRISVVLAVVVGMLTLVAGPARATVVSGDGINECPVYLWHSYGYYGQPPGATITQRVQQLTKAQLAGAVSAAGLRPGMTANVSCAPSSASLFDRPDYAGTCWEFDTESIDQTTNLDATFVPYLNAETYFRNNSDQSVGLGSRCGGQLLLYQNAYYNSGQTPNCSGFGCYAAIAPCSAGGSDCNVGTHTSGKQYGISISDAAIDSNANGAVEPALSIPDFTEFGTSSLLMPSGGAAAVYEKPNYQGGCMAMGVNFDLTSIDDLKDTGRSDTIPNDSARSIRLGQLCTESLVFFTGPLGNGGIVDSITQDTPSIYGANDSVANGIPDVEVSLYSQADYRGTCHSLTPNGEPGETELLHDTSVQSVRFGVMCPNPAGSVFLYPATKYGGTPHVLTASDTDLRTSGFNDIAQSLVNSTSQTISVYTDVDNGGVCYDVPAASAVPDLGSTVVGAGTISAVALSACPPAVVLGSATGGPLSVTGDIANLAEVGGTPLTVTNHTANTVSLWNGQSWTGICQNVLPGQSVYLAGATLPSPAPLNDVAGYVTPQSLKLSGACLAELELFQEPNYTGKHDFVRLDTATLGPKPASIVNNTAAPLALYSQPNYAGRCQTIAAYQQIPTLAGSEVGNRTIGSVRIGATCPAEVVLTPGATYTGPPTVVTTDTASLSIAQVGSLVNHTNHTISLYRRTGYRGVCENVTAGSAVPNLTGGLVGPRQARSIKLTGSCPERLLLFSGPSFTGTVFQLARTKSNLAELPLGKVAVLSMADNGAADVDLYAGTLFHGPCENVRPGETIANTTNLADAPLGAVHLYSDRIVSEDQDPCPPPFLTTPIVLINPF